MNHRLLASFVILSVVSAPGQAPSAPPTAGSVISRKDWGAASADESKLKDRPMGTVRFITIHHTESPTPDRIPETERLKSIQRGHMVADHQWGDIAYHYLIGPSGKIYEGRSPAFAASSGTVYLTPAEWAASGQDALGQTEAAVPLDAHGRKLEPPGATAGHLTVCLIGNFTNELPTPEAREAMARLVAHLLKTHSLKITDVAFHREVACWTDCPGQNLYDWFRGPARKRGAVGNGLRSIEAELHRKTGVLRPNTARPRLRPSPRLAPRCLPPALRW
jgi:hypothetical protein